MRSQFGRSEIQMEVLVHPIANGPLCPSRPVHQPGITPESCPATMKPVGEKQASRGKIPRTGLIRHRARGMGLILAAPSASIVPCIDPFLPTSRGGGPNKPFNPLLPKCIVQESWRCSDSCHDVEQCLNKNAMLGAGQILFELRSD